MDRLYKYFVSLSMLLCSISAYPQADSVKADFTPKGIRVGTDLSLIGRSIFDKNLSWNEFNIDAEFHRYLISFDYGLQSQRSKANDFNYDVKGNYYRVGIDANFNHNDGFGSVLFLGLRFASSHFDETLIYTISDPVFGISTSTADNKAVKANWFEAVAGLKVKVLGQLYLGFTSRFKFSKKIKSKTDFTTFIIPGYGKAAENSLFGMNYHVSYRIPFRKE